MTYTLSMFNTGQVTLPKKWREKFDTNKFIARAEGKKLILEPLEIIPESLQEKNIAMLDNDEGIRFKKGLRDDGLDYFIDFLEKNV